jgi:uncharacterized membrane protein
MFRPIPTNVHGILDYLTAPTLFVLPRMMKWNEGLTNTMTGASLGMLGYSMMTRYELGLFKVLPMKTHLILDAVAGATLVVTPFVVQKPLQRTLLNVGVTVGVGLFEIAASLMTQTEPSEVSATEAGPVNRLREMVTSGT